MKDGLVGSEMCIRDSCRTGYKPRNSRICGDGYIQCGVHTPWKSAKFVRRYELGTGHKLRYRGHTAGRCRICGTARYKLWDRVGSVEQLS